MNTPGTKARLHWILDAHRQGWSIFPCNVNSKTPAGYWYDMATNDLQTILTWWNHNPGFNIGVSAKKSGLLVVDCDVPKDITVAEDGWDQFQRLCKTRGVSWEDTIDTYQVETPSRGLHLYYWWPQAVTASQASLDSLLDVRSAGGEKGGYVLGPGSYVKNDEDPRRSGWYHVVNPAPIKAAPAWLVEECAEKEEVHVTSPFQRATAGSDGGLHRFVRDAPEGKRNDALFWAAAQKIEEDGELTVEDLYDLFSDDAVEAGLTTVEIRATIRSAYRKGRRHG